MKTPVFGFGILPTFIGMKKQKDWADRKGYTDTTAGIVFIIIIIIVIMLIDRYTAHQNL